MNVSVIKKIELVREKSKINIVEEIKTLKSSNIIKTKQKKGKNNNIILFTCGDGSKFRNMFLHEITEGYDKVHVLTTNGGPVSFFNYNNSLTSKGESVVDQICETSEFDKEHGDNILDVVVMSHYPCKAATKQNLSLKQIIDKTVQSVGYLEKRFPYLSFYPQFHVEFPEKKIDKNSFLKTLNIKRLAAKILERPKILLENPSWRTYDIVR